MSSNEIPNRQSAAETCPLRTHWSDGILKAVGAPARTLEAALIAGPCIRFPSRQPGSLPQDSNRRSPAPSSGCRAAAYRDRSRVAHFLALMSAMRCIEAVVLSYRHSSIGHLDLQTAGLSSRADATNSGSVPTMLRTCVEAPHQLPSRITREP